MIPTVRTLPRVTTALKILGACQVVSGFAGAIAVFYFAGRGTLEIIGEEIMMDGMAVGMVAYLLMFLVAATGVVSLSRMAWGWVLSFTIAALVLVMALLMGPGTIPVTRWSFLGLMILSLVNWATAVVHYHHDLYT